MRRSSAVLLALGCLIDLSVHRVAGAPAPAGPASPSEDVAVERFLTEIEKPPVAYQARRRLEASSASLKESAWMEVMTEYRPCLGVQLLDSRARRIRADPAACLEIGARSGEGQFHTRAMAEGKSFARELRVQLWRAFSRRDAQDAVGPAPPRLATREWCGAADRNLRRSGPRRRAPLEISFVLGQMGKRIEQLRAYQRLDDARRNRIDGRCQNRRSFHVRDDLRVPDGRWRCCSGAGNSRRQIGPTHPSSPNPPLAFDAPGSGRMLEAWRVSSSFSTAKSFASRIRRRR